MKKIFILGVLFAVAVPLVGFALPFPYWGTNPPLLPCTGAKCVSICQMVQLGQNVIWLGLSFVVFFLAPVFIAWGGILVMIGVGSIEEIGGKKQNISKGKGVIKSAILGLVIALFSFMIVNTFFVLMGITFDNQPINWADISCTQDLSKRPAPLPTRRVPGEPPRERAPSVGTGWVGADPPPGTLDDATARRELQDAGISIPPNRQTDCTYSGQTDCTSFTGIPQQAVDGAINIKENCDCQVTVTAGTEAGHETHGMGQAILDLRISPGLNKYIEKEIGTSGFPTPNEYYPGTDGNRYRYEVDHWHVEF